MRYTVNNGEKNQFAAELYWFKLFELRLIIKYVTL